MNPDLHLAEIKTKPDTQPWPLTHIVSILQLISSLFCDSDIIRAYREKMNSFINFCNYILFFK